MITTLFLLLVGHAVVDYSLQTEWIAKNKNPNAAGAPSGYDPKLHGPLQIIWPYVLTAHALQHGGAVYLVTGRLHLGLAEALCHWSIDYLKCQRWFGIHTDQGLHVLCKIVWACVAAKV